MIFDLRPNLCAYFQFIQGIWESSFDESSKGEARPHCLLARLAFMVNRHHLVTRMAINLEQSYYRYNVISLFYLYNRYIVISIILFFTFSKLHEM